MYGLKKTGFPAVEPMYGMAVIGQLLQGQVLYMFPAIGHIPEEAMYG
jgi:hypothetical protein